MTHTSFSLTEHHARQLAGSAIAESIIAERGYCSIAPGAVSAVHALAGGAFSQTLLTRILHGGALAFPIYRLGDPCPHTWMLRPDLPRSANDGDPIKYEYPRHTPLVLDLLPRYRDALGDPQVPIVFTEGAKKADALASAYGRAVVPINLNGVWGWRSRNASGGTTALADFELIAWGGRTVWIAADGDVRFNKQVQLAVQRLARLLQARYGVAELLALQLPMIPNGPKIGVDDYLAQGHTTAELESHLTSLGTLAQRARVALGAHPETQATLYLPPGYDVSAQTIVQIDAKSQARPIYAGAIFVKEIGVDPSTHRHTAVIAWNGRGAVHGEITIPYAALSDTRTFSSLVGAAGAALGPHNIKDVQQLLVEFVQENVDAIPRRLHVERLGLIDNGLMLPAGAIGFDEEVRYIGQPTIAVGTATEAYPAIIRQALRWPNAWAFWLALGLSLAAPAIARLRPRRNPVLYLSGASGSGKTTLVQFAAGCWGNPTRHPLRLEAGRTTPAGIIQTIEHLNGLPAFVDEAHTIADPRRLEMACYSFANGQRYTVGGADQRARGGSELYGTLFLAGEALPEFKHAGANLRVLWLDAGVWLPLGAEPGSSEGQERALSLEAAWEAGAGLFGLAVARRMWGAWPRFVANVHALETDQALAPLQTWRQPLALAAAALQVAFEVVGVTTADMPDPAAWAGQLLDAWTAMLTSGHDEADPATDAWEALLTMLAQGHIRDNGSSDAGSQGRVPASWEWIEADRGGGVIACRRAGDDYWRVMTRTPQFVERVGAQAVQLYGQTWVKRGWVRAANDGKSTDYQRIYGSGEEASARVLCLPRAMLEGWNPRS